MMKSDMDEWEYAQEFSQMNEDELIKRIKWYEKKYGPYITKRGFKNWRNLFRMPNMYEWTILLMIILSIFMAWAYTNDIAQCKETLNNLDVVCVSYCGSQTNQMPDLGLNLSGFIFKADNPFNGEG